VGGWCGAAGFLHSNPHHLVAIEVEVSIGVVLLAINEQRPASMDQQRPGAHGSADQNRPHPVRTSYAGPAAHHDNGYLI